MVLPKEKEHIFEFILLNSILLFIMLRVEFNYISTLIYNIIAAILSLIFIKLDFVFEKYRYLIPNPREIKKNIILGIFVGILLSGSVVFIFTIFGGFDAEINEYKLDVWISTIFFQSIVAISEELFFRGYLYDATNIYFNKLWSAVIISFVFGIGHLFIHKNWMQFWIAIFFSFIAIVIKEKYSLVAAIVAHFMYNMVLQILV